MQSKSIKELIFKTDSSESDDLKIQCFAFNSDEDRFCIVIGDDSELCDEDNYRLYFLDIEKATKLSEFINKHTQP